MRYPPGWYADPQGPPGQSRYWDGQTWTWQVEAIPVAPPGPVGPPGLPGGRPGPAKAFRPRRTSGLAIASLVLSILWLGGLGAMLAVVFGVQSRRQIRGTGGTLGGNGLAIAGIVIGVIGLLVTIDLSVAGVIQVRVGEPASTPRTGALGQVLRIPAGYSDNGISRVTVYSVTFPVASQDPIISAPDLGKEFAVADVQMCAGRDGSQDGPNAFNFFLIFADGTDVSAAVGAIRNPSVSDVNTLGPGQCSRGWVPFQIAAGTQPAAVQYGLINGFRWTLPASG